MKSIRKLGGLSLGCLFCYLFFGIISTASWARIHIQNDVVICYTAVPDNAFPDFNSSKCSKTKFVDINPTDKQLWLKATVVISEERLAKNLPWGLFISGKASSEAYINGTLVGNNGAPSADVVLD